MAAAKITSRSLSGISSAMANGNAGIIKLMKAINSFSSGSGHVVKNAMLVGLCYVMCLLPNSSGQGHLPRKAPTTSHHWPPFCLWLDMASGASSSRLSSSFFGRKSGGGMA